MRVKVSENKDEILHTALAAVLASKLDLPESMNYQLHQG